MRRPKWGDDRVLHRPVETAILSGHREVARVGCKFDFYI
jgi:hypothetical protein